jgi:hypothetical protein
MLRQHRGLAMTERHYLGPLLLRPMSPAVSSRWHDPVDDVSVGVFGEKPETAVRCELAPKGKTGARPTLNQESLQLHGLAVMPGWQKLQPFRIRDVARGKLSTNCTRMAGEMIPKLLNVVPAGEWRFQKQCGLLFIVGTGYRYRYCIFNFRCRGPSNASKTRKCGCRHCDLRNERRRTYTENDQTDSEDPRSYWREHFNTPIFRVKNKPWFAPLCLARSTGSCTVQEADSSRTGYSRTYSRTTR